jgi:hypothetical protein
MKKRYIINKHVLASSLREALNLEKRTPVDEIYLDQKYEGEDDAGSKEEIGFK